MTMEKIKVVADFDWLENEETIGLLGHESQRGTDVYTFEYDKDWLKRHPSLNLGKELQSFPGVQYNPTRNRIFGTFSDALPDRWGRRLIDLRIHQEMKDSGERRVNISDWDYLKGVEDSLRMGAFRFKDIATDAYISYNKSYSIPPILFLDELLEAAGQIEKSELNRMEPESRWIQRLFQPGSSMGGARPKACVKEGEDLYVAKFPSVGDEINISRWEYFAHSMAKDCGINAAECRVVSSKDSRDVLLSKRFDRTENGKRIHMASSLTLLGLNDGDGESTGKGYLDIVDFIVANGSVDMEKELEELYRRVAFNICIGNTDDHFRNHAFLLKKDGWHLSPAYDMNPTNKYYHSLLIDGYTNESSLDVLYDAHESYMLDETTARGIIKDVTRNMKYWESMALRCGLSRSDLKVFQERIEEGMEWKCGSTLHR